MNNLLSLPWVFLTQSYWRDEVFRVLLARNSLMDIIRLTYNDGQPPLYYFILHFWMMIFGDGEVATRTLSLICFEILLFVVWRFSQLLKPKAIIFSLSAVALVFFNPSLIYYAFEARVYLLFTLAVTTSCYFLYKRNYYWWTIFSIIGLYTHNFMIFILPFQIIWAWFQLKNKKLLVKCLLIMAISYLPWVSVFWHQAQLIKNDFWIHPLSLDELKTALGGIFFGYENDPVCLVSFFKVISLAVVFFLVFSAKNKPGKFCILWSLVPLLLVLSISFWIRPIFLARYLSFMAIPLSFSLSIALSRLPKGLSLIILSLCLLILIHISVVLFPFRIKPDIQKTVIEIASMIKANDVIHTTSLNFFETKYYFAKFTHPGYTKTVAIKIYSPKNFVPFFVGKVLINNEDITNQIPKYQRVFTIDQKARFVVSGWY